MILFIFVMHQVMKCIQKSQDEVSLVWEDFSCNQMDLRRVQFMYGLIVTQGMRKNSLLTWQKWAHLSAYQTHPLWWKSFQICLFRFGTRNRQTGTLRESKICVPTVSMCVWCLCMHWVHWSLCSWMCFCLCVCAFICLIFGVKNTKKLGTVAAHGTQQK